MDGGNKIMVLATSIRWAGGSFAVSRLTEG